MPSEDVGKAVLAVIEARENIRLIRDWAADLTLESMKEDRKTRYAIERAFMAIDAALRDLPSDLAAAHGIPVKLIAGFRNVLAHTYDDILDERVMLTISDDLPALDAALARMLQMLER